MKGPCRGRRGILFFCAITIANIITATNCYPHLKVKRFVEGGREIVGVLRKPGALLAVLTAIHIPC